MSSIFLVSGVGKVLTLSGLLSTFSSILGFISSSFVGS